MRPNAMIRRPVTAALLVGMAASACAVRWREVRVMPQPSKQTLYVGDVRVLTTDGMVYGFRGVWVRSDSLGGWLMEPAGLERSFALGDVARVETRSSSSAAGGSSLRTIDKLGPLGAVIALGALAVALATVDVVGLP